MLSERRDASSAHRKMSGGCGTAPLGSSASSIGGMGLRIWFSGWYSDSVAGGGVICGGLAQNRHRGLIG